MKIKLSDKQVAAQNDIFRAVGAALDAWMSVEDNLASIFRLCINMDNYLAAQRSYWAVFSFQSRLDMVHAAVQAKLFHDLIPLEEWGSTYNRLSRRAKQRNKIAHGRMAWGPYGGGIERRTVPFWSPFHSAYEAESLPARAKDREKTYPNGFPRDRLFVPDIESLQATFEKDSAGLIKFWKAIHPIIQREEETRRMIAETHRRAVSDLRAARTLKGKQPPPQSSEE